MHREVGRGQCSHAPLALAPQQPLLPVRMVSEAGASEPAVSPFGQDDRYYC